MPSLDAADVNDHMTAATDTSAPGKQLPFASKYTFPVVMAPLEEVTLALRARKPVPLMMPFMPRRR
jgi:hypothetical protein